MTSVDRDTLNSLLGLPPDSIERQVNDCIYNAITKLAPYFDKQIIPPKVVYDLKGTTAGQATSSNKIRLNLDALLDSETRDYMFDQTIPHEVAHIVEFQMYGRAGHGYPWQQLMRRLGLRPDRTHNLPLKKARVHPRPWKYVCDSCNNERMLTNYKHIKLTNNPNYYVCGRCNGRLRYVG